ncbi:hypothetical protein KBTX_04399 [wastewater metagenome]|uniref:Uncharacterized protein n=2 Tax=unclassified sequences TaxID=12908 RepID=A0A5B8RHA5_9ZZZZ|nr:hypothetical protein KBTEX_04399 [uncultured organism]
MSDAIDLDAMFAEMDRAADRAERTLDGRFGDIYRELRALTPEQIDGITPDTTDQREYERLMALVQEASERNMEQGELINRIRELGTVAKQIAQQVSGLRGLV